MTLSSRLPSLLLPLLVAGQLSAADVQTPAPARQNLRLPSGTQALRNLAYAENGHERQKLDLYLPETAQSKLPLIIWIHGGAWKAGSKDNCPALRFLSQGYAVASVNYRLSQHAVFPAQIEDCKSAVRWLRAHAKEYKLDPNRFAAWGASAGGHLVAMLGVTGDTKDYDIGQNLDYSSAVQAVVVFFGPTDLLRMAAQSGPNSIMNHDAPNSPESELVGGAVQDNPEKARKASPASYITGGDPPFLLVHGDQDPLVPWQQSQVLCEALKKAGVEANLRIVKGAGHGTGFGAPEDQAVADFLARHLKPSQSGTAAPSR